MSRNKNKAWGRSRIQHANKKRAKAERIAGEAIADRLSAYKTLHEIQQEYGSTPDEVLLNLASKVRELQNTEAWLKAEGAMLDLREADLEGRIDQLSKDEETFRKASNILRDQIDEHNKEHTSQLALLNQRSNALALLEGKYKDMDRDSYIKKLERRLALKSKELEQARAVNSRYASQMGDLVLSTPSTES